MTTFKDQLNRLTEELHVNKMDDAFNDYILLQQMRMTCSGLNDERLKTGLTEALDAAIKVIATIEVPEA